MKYITLITTILLIGIVSASSYDISAGENISFDLSQEYEYYSIIGNSTPIDLNLTQNGTIVTIFFSKYSQSDNFNIIFFDSEKEVIHHYGGGCSRCKVKEPENNCTVIVQNDEPEGSDEPINISNDNPEEGETKSNKKFIGIFLMLIACFWGLMVWLYRVLKKNKKEVIKKSNSKMSKKRVK
jgi:hypothetical protein